MRTYWRERKFKANRSLGRQLLPIWWVVVALWAAACSGATPPPSSGIVPQLTATIPASVSAPPANPTLQPLSAGQRLRFEHLSIEQGLSQNTVFGILQDSRGFMWFGTEDGLNKYDGYTFTAYKHDPEDPGSISDNWIWSIYQDRSGVLWVGTLDGGLNRFDRESETFGRYQHDPQDPHSLSDNEVTSIYEDKAGVLWVGTSGGLDRLDRTNETLSHYRHDPDDPHSLSANAVLSIYEDREGELWIGTDGGGLDRLDRANETFVHHSNDPGNPHSLSHNTVRAIYEDREGVLWVGTDEGLDRLDRENSRFIRYSNDPDDPHSLGFSKVRSLYQDREGVFWVGTWGGGLDWLVHSASSGQALSADAPSDDEGFDREKGTFAHYRNDTSDPHSLSNDYIASIYQDREGTLWIGTLPGGINKLNAGQRNFGLYQHDPNNANSLSDNWVRSIYEDRDGVLWIGTGSGGLNRFDRGLGGGRWRRYQHDPNDPGSLSDNWVSLIHQDRSGMLWIGTASGLDRLDPTTERITHYQHDPGALHSLSESNGVFVVEEDNAGMLWIGTNGGGLDRFDRGTGHWSHYRHDPNDPHSLVDDSVWSFLQDREGVIWIGTGRGLERFDPETQGFVHYQHDPDDPHSLSDSFVGPIYEDQEGVLWIGTIGGGLNRFDRSTETFSRYREKDGLPSDLIMGIQEDEQGALWLSTNKGLSKFDPQSEISRNYDWADGLPFVEFNGGAFHRSRSGEMFAGGIEGLIVFHPDRLRDNPILPPVVLTALTQDGQPLAAGGGLDNLTQVTLKWPDDSFEFEFAALSYAHPEKNQYAYKLEGVDEDWITVGSRRYGRYTHLPGGTYSLRLKGSNDDGLWNETDALLTVTVVPPFWATWWFRGLLLLFLGTVAAAGYRLRVRSVEARSHELAHLVKDRTTELSRANLLLEGEIAERKRAEGALAQRTAEVAVTEERNRLSRDLHDSVTQSLYAVTLYADAVVRLLSAGQADSVADNLRKLRGTARDALGEMRLLIYELRPPILEQEGLVAAIETRLQAVEGRSGLGVQMNAEGKIDLPPEVQGGLYRIAQESLNNVLKHARAHNVTVLLRQGEDQAVILEIADDGVGFDLAAARDRGGMGLRGMAERVEQLGGQLEIESEPGAGTTVRVQVEGDS